MEGRIYRCHFPKTQCEVGSAHPPLPGQCNLRQQGPQVLTNNPWVIVCSCNNVTYIVRSHLIPIEYFCSTIPQLPQSHGHAAVANGATLLIDRTQGKGSKPWVREAQFRVRLSESIYGTNHRTAPEVSESPLGTVQYSAYRTKILRQQFHGDTSQASGSLPHFIWRQVCKV